MFKLINPIPKQIRDSEQISQAYGNLRLIPYVSWDSYSGHRFMRLLTDLAQLSATQGNTISDLKKWCFGGELDFTESIVPGLKVERKELGDKENIRIAQEFEKYGVTPTLISNVTKRLFLSRKKTGNSYLYYKEIMVGGTKRVKLEALPPQSAMYIETKDNEPKTVAISDSFFDYRSFTTKEPKLVRVFPDFSGTATERETVFHCMTESEDTLHYGLPDSIQTLYWQAVEWYQSLLTLKVSKTETVAKAILAMMNPDPNSLGQGETPQGIGKEIRVSLNKLVTNKGTDEAVDSLGVIGYPFGGNAPELLKLDINRDKDYLQTALDIASSYITAAHGWDKTLIGQTPAKSGIGGNVLIDTFETKNASTIRPTQREYEAEWGQVFRLIAGFTGGQDLGEVSPRFEDRVKSLIENLSDRNKTTAQNGTDENADKGNGSSEAVQNGQALPNV